MSQINYFLVSYRYDGEELFVMDYDNEKLCDGAEYTVGGIIKATRALLMNELEVKQKEIVNASPGKRIMEAKSNLAAVITYLQEYANHVKYTNIHVEFDSGYTLKFKETKETFKVDKGVWKR